MYKIPNVITNFMMFSEEVKINVNIIMDVKGIKIPINKGTLEPFYKSFLFFLRDLYNKFLTTLTSFGSFFSSSTRPKIPCSTTSARLVSLVTLLSS